MLEWGVLGGYQSAPPGPSMSPSGDDKALELILPFLKKVASKDGKRRPCVGKVGEGGSGRYVKMIHNGIEHGMMSAISKAWEIMNTHLDMEYDAIGKVFEHWNSEGELVIKIYIAGTDDTDANS
jgi:6-phosphogluconate dehydrogenase